MGSFSRMRRGLKAQCHGHGRCKQVTRIDLLHDQVVITPFTPTDHTRLLISLKRIFSQNYWVNIKEIIRPLAFVEYGPDHVDCLSVHVKVILRKKHVELSPWTSIT